MNSFFGRLSLVAVGATVAGALLWWQQATEIPPKALVRPATIAGPAVLGVALGSRFGDLDYWVRKADLHPSMAVPNWPGGHMHSIHYIAGTLHDSSDKSKQARLACDDNYMDYRGATCTVAVFHGLPPKLDPAQDAFDDRVIWRIDLYQRLNGDTPSEEVIKAMEQRWGKPGSELLTEADEPPHPGPAQAVANLPDLRQDEAAPSGTRPIVVRWLLWGGKGKLQASEPPTNPLTRLRANEHCRSRGCERKPTLVSSLPFEATDLDGKVIVATLSGRSPGLTDTVHVSAVDLETAREVDKLRLIAEQRAEKEEKADAAQKEEATRKKMLRY